MSESVIESKWNRALVCATRRHYKLKAELAAMTWRIRWDEIRVDTGHRKRKTDLDAPSGPSGAKGPKGHSPAPDGGGADMAASPTTDEVDAKPKKRKRKDSKAPKKGKEKQPVKNGSASFSQKLIQRVARVRLLHSPLLLSSLRHCRRRRLQMASESRALLPPLCSTCCTQQHTQRTPFPSISFRSVLFRSISLRSIPFTWRSPLADGTAGDRCAIGIAIIVWAGGGQWARRLARYAGAPGVGPTYRMGAAARDPRGQWDLEGHW